MHHAAVSWILLNLLQAELLVETFNTSASVNQLLLAGIERVTLGADFNSDILLGRPGLKHGTTSTANGGLLIIGMDSLLHVCSPLSVPVKAQSALKI